MITKNTLWREYKFKQSLLFTIQRCLCSCTEQIKDNVYQIYNLVKILKNQDSNTTNNTMMDITQQVA